MKRLFLMAGGILGFVAILALGLSWREQSWHQELQQARSWNEQEVLAPIPLASPPLPSSQEEEVVVSIQEEQGYEEMDGEVLFLKPKEVVSQDPHSAEQSFTFLEQGEAFFPLPQEKEALKANSGKGSGEKEVPVFTEEEEKVAKEEKLKSSLVGEAGQQEDSSSPELLVSTPLKRAVAVKPKVVILAYHQFLPGSEWGANSHRTPSEVFEEQMAYLQKEGYEVLSLKQLQAGLKGEASLPALGAVITIDNGFQNAMTVAAPVLRKYGYPWTFFVYTNLIGASSRSVTWEDLASLQSEGVEIQSQTRSHPFLTRFQGKKEPEVLSFFQKELQAPREAIEQRINQPVYALALPYGNSNVKVQEEAQKAGYEAILTVEPSFVTPQTSLLSLPRFVVTKESAPYFETFLSGEPGQVEKLVPSPGSIVPEKQPEIMVQLQKNFQLNQDSLKMEIAGLGQVTPQYDASMGTIRFQLPQDFQKRVIRVVVSAKQDPSQKPWAVSWYFYLQNRLRPNE